MIVRVLVSNIFGISVNRCFLSLGSNIKSRIKFLEFGISELFKIKKIKINKISAVYETPPMHYIEQNKFLNIVLSIETTFNPLQLLKAVKKIEFESGREKTKQNYPRTLDIDILSYDDITLETEEIIIPHPRLGDRKFVLQPWCDIESDFILHDCGKSVKELLKLTRDKSKINKVYDESIFLSYLH